MEMELLGVLVSQVLFEREGDACNSKPWPSLILLSASFHSNTTIMMLIKKNHYHE